MDELETARPPLAFAPEDATAMKTKTAPPAEPHPEPELELFPHRTPAPNMKPQVTLELLTGSGRKKAIGSATVYNAIAIHGITVVEGKAQTLQVRMPRAPRGAQTRHSDIAYPINKTARQTLYGAVLHEYERLYAAAEAERQKTKLQIPD